MNLPRTLRSLGALALAAVVSAALWLPPLGGALQVSGAYVEPASPYGPGHRGIDLPATPGDAVIAPVSGTVSFVGTVVDRPLLSIRLEDDTVVSLEPVDASDLSVGDRVLRGEQIGVVAEGGHCASECLHLGVRVEERYVNPMRFFFAKPVLLPLSP